jgi:hypothetical protein
MQPPNDEDDEARYDEPTAEELEWQAIQARLDAYHEECWESVFGDVLRGSPSERDERRRLFGLATFDR